MPTSSAITRGQRQLQRGRESARRSARHLAALAQADAELTLQRIADEGANCTKKGWSRPRSLRSMSRCSTVASWPSRLVTGSPTYWNSMKAMKATVSITITACSRRRRMKASIASGCVQSSVEWSPSKANRMRAGESPRPAAARSAPGSGASTHHEKRTSPRASGSIVSVRRHRLADWSARARRAGRPSLWSSRSWSTACPAAPRAASRQCRTAAAVWRSRPGPAAVDSEVARMVRIS
jgi:hypothetical protein